MIKRLDADKVREKLNAFLDKNYMISSSMWAARMGLSHVAFLKFVNGATKPHRKTIGIIDTFITNTENTIKRVDPAVCEVCGKEPEETYYVDWGDGIPHWVCFEHMKK